MSIRQEIIDQMVERRREFHSYPEAGWAEFRTTARIAEILEDLGYATIFGGDLIKAEDVMGRTIDPNKEKKRAVEQGASPSMIERVGDYTGVAAELNTGEDGPVTALRFDIDCVETSEAEDDRHIPAKEGFRSRNQGWMHACGHDGHTAIGLALAQLAAEEKAQFAGKIRFIFQPAEEGVRGGYAMTRAGLLDGVDYFIALHLGLGHPTGTVFGGTNGFLCTTKFDVDYCGAGAHAGIEPEKGKNALLAAASAALGLHSIAPHSAGATRINVGVLKAGEGRNVVPPKAQMKIETRGENIELGEYIYSRAEEVVRAAASMYGVECNVTKCGESISAESDVELARIVVEAAAETTGVKSAELFSKMGGSDDACWMMKKVQDGGGKATYIGLGATTAAGHHNGRFDFDEKALPIGAELLERVIKRLNGR